MRVIFFVILALGLTSSTSLAREVSSPDPKFQIHQMGEYIYKEMHSAKASGSPSPRFTAIINGFLDEIFAALRLIIRQLELYYIPLPNIENIPIGDSIGVNLTNGFLSGFHTFHRTGDCMLNIEPNGDIMILIDLGGNEFALYYDIAVKLFGIPLPALSLEGHLAWIDFRASLRIAADFSIRVEKFEFDNVGVIALKIPGLGEILDVIVQFLSQIITGLFKNSVLDYLATTIKDLLNYILSNITLVSIPNDSTATTLTIANYPENLVKSILASELASTLPLNKPKPAIRD